MELVYIGLLLISCILLFVQLCIRAWFPSTQRWGQLLNAFAAVFTVLGGTAAFLIFTFATFFPVNYLKVRHVCYFCLLRSARDGRSHDVHAGVSDDCLDGTRRLQTSQLWLLMGILVSSINIYI